MICWQKFIYGTCAILFSLSATADDSIKNKMYGDIDFIKNTLKIQYAPLEWKSSYYGWDLDAEVAKAKSSIANKANITVKDYQFIVKRFLNTADDYHVAIRFYSTEAAFLPFRIKGAQGRYFFTYIDRSHLSPAVYPIHEGDELISYNGRPIAEAIKNFKNLEVGGDNSIANQSIAETYFTARFGAEGHEVPKGPVMLGVKSKRTGKVSSYQIMWHYLPEEIKNPFPQQRIAAHSAALCKKENKEKKPISLKDHPLFQKMMLSSHFENFKGLACNDDLGSRRSFIPPLGEKIWESDYYCPFYAYIFENKNGKKIGYIRIPHYINFDNEVDEFKHIIALMQENTEALVIDQINNPGGRLFYLYALVSMLTDQPVSAPRHRISLTQKEIAFAIEVIPLIESIQTDEDARAVMGDLLEGNQVTFQSAQFFLNYLRFIIDEWNSGNITTAPTYLWGIDFIPPHPEVRYTKPIVVLINSLDFSGGDFFAAILQDSKRATLMGTQTAGAGGFVLQANFPNIFGIEYFTYTASLAERTNSQVIENLGVSPDVHYELSVNDLQNNYCEYTARILETVDQVLEKE